MSNCKIFDIYYRTSNGQTSKLESIDEENVKCELDKIFKKEDVIFAGVTKHKEYNMIFYHSVFRGTIVMDKNYEGASVKKNGVTVMKIGRDGERQVKSNYPRWDYHIFEHCDGILNIEELLKNI